MDDMIGRTLDRYRIIEQIGMGGMATVYKAYEPGMSRYVAIKLMPPNLAREPRFRAAFESEASIITRLEHPYILPVYAKSATTEPLPYLVMRYIDGGTLADLIASGQLTIARAVRLVAQVAEALAYAHRLDFIHRDIKPSNILIGADGSALLSDFGIAKIMEATSLFSSTGVAIGTPAYMSPEQAQGHKQIDGRTDIYALGVVLYQAVTGDLPFSAETPLAVLMMHINNPLMPPRQVNPDVPEALEQVILRAMAKRPQDRFATADTMAEALRLVSSPATLVPAPPAIQTSRSFAAPPPSATPTAPQPSALPTPASAPVAAAPTAVATSQPAAPAQPGRRWLWPAIAGALAVAVLGLALTLFFRTGSTDLPTGPVAEGGVAGAPTSAPVVTGAAEMVLPTAEVAESIAADVGQLTSVPNQECQATIAFGQNIHCALESQSEIDNYTFEAKTNDVVVLRSDVEQVGSVLRVTLFDPQRKKVTACDTSGCTLSSDGIYTIRIENAVGRAPYKYTLYIDRLNDPVNVQPISFDKTLTGALESQSEIDNYTFEAKTNDVVVLRSDVEQVGSVLRVTLFDPQRKKVTACDTSGCTLSSDGIYTIRIENAVGRAPYKYTLYLHRL